MKSNKPALLKKNYWKKMPDEIIVRTNDDTVALHNRRNSSGRASIHEHEGSKYLRKIFAADGSKQSILIDVYCVLKAFDEPPGPVAHAIKKLLCAGKRGKGDRKADLIGVLAAINRAIDQLEEDEYGETTPAS
jgi:hypothetical protein